MQTCFLLGPAGSGKTYRCLKDIRSALISTPEGPPLIFLAPKQATFQLERQLLDDPALHGFTRLHILSFERLARFIFSTLGKAPPQTLDEEGRLMVLRSLLARHAKDLKLFRASARLTGFAGEISLVLRELQRHQLTPAALDALAAKAENTSGLSSKLHDLAFILRAYKEWLHAHNLEDADAFLSRAAEALKGQNTFKIDGLWLDGFAELCPQELDLLAAVIPCSTRATLAFCLDNETSKPSWLSTWSVGGQSFNECFQRITALPDVQSETERLKRDPITNRFSGNPVLAHLEQYWTHPQPFIQSDVSSALRIVTTSSMEDEVVFAARQILKFVRNGNRFREVSILTRNLEDYHHLVSDIFARYQIPCFLDRRESVSNHPLAELTRSSLRNVLNNWEHDDWFTALKTNLVPADPNLLDQLENESLLHGWKGDTWRNPLSHADDPDKAHSLEPLRKKIVPPFLDLHRQLSDHSHSGPGLARVIRDFWDALKIETQLQDWNLHEKSASHLTVWEQMNAWLKNLELAFPDTTLSLAKWMPILEAGLANLTVGVIPPSLDQVLVGAIDRSRNPDIKLAIFMGMNESVFPAPPTQSALLTDHDIKALQDHDVHLASGKTHQLAHEHYFGYIACTRARDQLILTHASHDSDGKPLSHSPFLSNIKKLFPFLVPEAFSGDSDWRQAEHAHELMAPLLHQQLNGGSTYLSTLLALDKLPFLSQFRQRLSDFASSSAIQPLSPALAEKLYGATLHSSVSSLEQFAACPFKFLVHAGLKAKERALFELDFKERGNFQHDVLEKFHNQLAEENKHWRDITPVEARDRIKSIADKLAETFRHGLLSASEKSRFATRVMTESLQDFIETIVGWMHSQYLFDPKAVEVEFNAEQSGWTMDLGDGHRLALKGRIDRIDLYHVPGSDEAHCVVIDYKSSGKKVDSLLMEHGIQMQLAVYLSVLKNWKNPRDRFGAGKLTPAGVFFVSLRGHYAAASNRNDALENSIESRRLAYRHSGRFDVSALSFLDSRETLQGDQFNYKRTKAGFDKRRADSLESQAITILLDHVEQTLQSIGQNIFRGNVNIDPYRKGKVTACVQCSFQGVCRVDPWTHQFRVLKKSEDSNLEEEGE